VKAISKEHLTQ